MRKYLLFAMALLGVLAFSVPAHAIIPNQSLTVFAVAPDGTALDAELMLKLVPGNGTVWSSVSGPLVGTATQSTEKIAVKLAKNYSPDVDKYDYFFSIDSEASVVDGPSAGSAMALLVVSSLQDKKIPSNVGLTGTITHTGEVGPVGGIFEKSKEAAKGNVKLFLIPEGESRQVVKMSDGVKNIFLPDYALEEWGMKIVETRNLDDVLKYAYSDIGSIDISQTAEAEESVYIPEKIVPSPSAEALGKLNTLFIQQTRDATQRAQNALNHTLLDDAGLIEVLSRSVSDSEKTANEAELLTQNGYHYSAGNFAFLARVNAYFVEDVSNNSELINMENGLLEEWVDTLLDKIEEQQKIFDKTVPIEGVEWYIAAQQRLTWAKTQLEELKEISIIEAATQDAEHAQAVSRVQDYEFARAWYESSSEFYNVGVEKSTKGLKTQTPFADYYTDFLTNAENGLTLIQDGTGADAERRLNAAKMDKLNEHHLSAAMNAASALALVNAILIESDGEKDVRETLETKITQLETKLKDKPTQYGWANLYLDHAKYYLNSANYYMEKNQGAVAASSLSSGLSLILLAENTYEVTKDVQEYYATLPESRFTLLNGIASPVGNGNGGTIPISINGEGKGSVLIQTSNGNPIPLEWILGIIVLFLAVVLIVSYSGRIQKMDWGKRADAPNELDVTLPAINSRILQQVDELEARLFAAKQGLRHAAYQHANGLLSKEAFEEISGNYSQQMRETGKKLRKASAELRGNEKRPKNETLLTKKTIKENEPTKKWPAKKGKKKGKKNKI
ncbi:MAG: S16 family serine protease [Candidatus Diapherotrites archaeon]